jgi:hypothetical protein
VWSSLQCLLLRRLATQSFPIIYKKEDAAHLSVGPDAAPSTCAETQNLCASTPAYLHPSKPTQKCYRWIASLPSAGQLHCKRMPPCIIESVNMTENDKNETFLCHPCKTRARGSFEEIGKTSSDSPTPSRLEASYIEIAKACLHHRCFLVELLATLT